MLLHLGCSSQAVGVRLGLHGGREQPRLRRLFAKPLTFWRLSFLIIEICSRVQDSARRDSLLCSRQCSGNQYLQMQLVFKAAESAQHTAEEHNRYNIVCKQVYVLQMRKAANFAKCMRLSASRQVEGRQRACTERG